MIDVDVSALSDRQAIRALELVVDHGGPVPATAQLRELEEGIREAVTDPELAAYQDADQPPATEGELARTALAHLAASPERVEVVRRAISIAIDDASRSLTPTALAIGALVLLALQTEVELTRSSTGRWRLRVHKQAMRESTLGQLLGKLIGLYRR